MGVVSHESFIPVAQLMSASGVKGGVRGGNVQVVRSARAAPRPQARAPRPVTPAAPAVPLSAHITHPAHPAPPHPAQPAPLPTATGKLISRHQQPLTVLCLT